MNLYQTSFSVEELDTSQLALESPLTVAFARSPEVETHVVFGVSDCAAEQLSFVGGGEEELTTLIYFLGVYVES